MPYYGPDEDANTVNLERIFLAGDFISGVNLGILSCMYAACIWVLWSRRNRRISTFLMIYITILFITLIISSAVSVGTIQQMYIDNRNYPGGPWSYFLATQSLAINVIWITTYFLLTFFADSLIFWRCWIIWSASGRRVAFIATLFPGLLLLASFAVGTVWVLLSSQPGISLDFYTKIPLAFGAAYYSLSIGMNVFLTILITSKLLIYRRRFKNSSASTDPVQFYTSLLTIFIESAALYSTFSICFLISYGVNKTINEVFVNLTTAAQQISAYLIVYRLALGTAWQRDTLEKKIVSTIRFQVNVRTPATIGSSGIFGITSMRRSAPTESTGNSSQPVAEVKSTYQKDSESAV